MHIALLTRARAVRCLLAPCIGALLMAMHGMAGAQAPAPRAATDGVDTAAAPATLYLHNRQVATFRQSVMGDAPADRVRLAELALQGVLQQPGDDAPRLRAAGESMRVELRGVTLFYLTAADLSETPSPLPLEINAQRVLHRLQLAIAEYREARDPRRLLRGAAQAAGATVLALLLLRALFWLRRRALDALSAWLAAPAERLAGWMISYLEPLGALLRLATGAVTWIVAAVLAEAWASYVLNQFPYTRPWGERSAAWMLGTLRDFALAIASAVPGLIVAGLIFALARMMVRATAAMLLRVERGHAHLPWVDRDTAAPTRRLAAVLIWLFALAMAYPYLPGAQSEAFKGVTVIAGLMLSLGASSVVGQALSGLSLMYSRSVRAGEYVKVGDTEGTVVALGLFTTRIHTGMDEEVSLPNTVMFSQPIRNLSRLAEEGQFVLHTSVTIGYATPWRQVHALLLEAARRTPAVAQEPPPYVVQTALSDFYVEYRLCARSGRHAPHRRVEAMNQLHANVQDVFNENGVQIMSPHYLADPPEPQVVPPGPWASQPAQAPSTPVPAP